MHDQSLIQIPWVTEHLWKGLKYITEDILILLLESPKIAILVSRSMVHAGFVI